MLGLKPHVEGVCVSQVGKSPSGHLFKSLTSGCIAFEIDLPDLNPTQRAQPELNPHALVPQNAPTRVACVRSRIEEFGSAGAARDRRAFGTLAACRDRGGRQNAGAVQTLLGVQLAVRGTTAPLPTDK